VTQDAKYSLTALAVASAAFASFYFATPLLDMIPLPRWFLNLSYALSLLILAGELIADRRRRRSAAASGD
jgi:hypothetical protein